MYFLRRFAQWLRGMFNNRPTVERLTHSECGQASPCQKLLFGLMTDA